MPHPLPMRLNPTRSGDLERKAGEKELENREAQRGAGEEAGDERDVREIQRAVCGLFLSLWLQSLWMVMHPCQSPGPLRRCKLQVLDSWTTDQNFWSVWSGASSQGCSHSGMAPVVEQSSRTHQALAPLKVYTDLCLKKRTLDNFLSYLPRWVAQRKA